MREHKFKYIWENDITGEFTYKVFSLTEIECGFLSRFTKNELCEDHDIHLGRAEYTGLKDKNGVEIYEGDVIICTRYTGGKKEGQIYSSFHVKYETYDIGSNGYEYSNIIHGLLVEDEYLYGLMTEGKTEVIGNIYENPELLNA